MPKSSEKIEEKYLRKYGKYLKGDFSGLPLLPKESEVKWKDVSAPAPQQSTGKASITVFFDGLCQPRNPRGVASYGFVIYGPSGEKFGEGSGLACEPWSYQASNNAAEYQALIKALEWLLEHDHEHDVVTVKGDSQLAPRQMDGSYVVNAPRIVPLHRTARNLAERFRQIHFIWVPREHNEEADLLSQKAYADYMTERARKEAEAIPANNVTMQPDGRFLVQRSTVNLESRTCSCTQSKLHKLRLKVEIPCCHILAAEREKDETT